MNDGTFQQSHLDFLVQLLSQVHQLLPQQVSRHFDFLDPLEAQVFHHVAMPFDSKHEKPMTFDLTYQNFNFSFKLFIIDTLANFDPILYLLSECIYIA